MGEVPDRKGSGVRGRVQKWEGRGDRGLLYCESD